MIPVYIFSVPLYNGEYEPGKNIRSSSCSEWMGQPLGKHLQLIFNST